MACSTEPAGSPASPPPVPALRVCGKHGRRKPPSSPSNAPMAFRVDVRITRNSNEPCARCSPETCSVPLGALAAAAARNGPRTAGLAGTRTTLPSQTW